MLNILTWVLKIILEILIIIFGFTVRSSKICLKSRFFYWQILKWDDNKIPSYNIKYWSSLLDEYILILLTI